MGAGARTKKIALFNVKVYAITLYVEADKAARELGIRKRGGFFDDDNDDDYALALADGGFDKVGGIQRRGGTACVVVMCVRIYIMRGVCLCITCVYPYHACVCVCL